MVPRGKTGTHKPLGTKRSILALQYFKTQSEEKQVLVTSDNTTQRSFVPICGDSLLGATNII